jgi:hypothetical protein
LLAHGRWFSPGTLASSITKTDLHDIAEILLKLALNTKSNQNDSLRYNTYNRSLSLLTSYHIPKLLNTAVLLRIDNERQH